MNSSDNYRCVLLTHRFLIYVADLNHIMLLFDVGLGWVTSDYISHGLGWVCEVMGWVGLGWGWVTENGPTAMSDSVSNSLLIYRVCAAPTRIFEGPTSQTVNAGDEVVLRCGAVTDPSEPLTVEWRHDGVPVNFETSSHLHFDEESHSLVIKSAAVTDTAAYTCHAGNGLDEVESPTATLTVRGIVK